MHFASWDDLKKEAPFCDGAWDMDKLKEYLIYVNYKGFDLPIRLYFARFREDGALADLLLEFLLDDDYEGSEAQIGAAYFLGRMDRAVLRERRAGVLKAQESPVFWRRPFQTEDYLEWL